MINNHVWSKKKQGSLLELDRDCSVFCFSVAVEGGGRRERKVREAEAKVKAALTSRAA